MTLTKKAALITSAGLIATGICAALTAPADASSRPHDAPPCGTSYTDLNPAPGEQLGITYNNCWGSGYFTPFQHNSNTAWVYQACKYIANGAWDSWTVTTPSRAVNFGVGTCDSQSTHPYISDWSPIKKYTHFDPPNPGPGGHVHQTYWNVDPGDPQVVAPAYETTGGNWGFYLHDGCLSVSGAQPTAAHVWIGNWTYYAPQVPASLKTVFCL